jgi:hypothetical protein
MTQPVLKACGQAFSQGGGNMTVAIVLPVLTDHLRAVTWLTGLLAGQVTIPGYIDVAHPLPS